MIVKVTDLWQGENGKEIEMQDISIADKAIIAIDASTATTGVCLLDLKTAKPLYSISMKRGKDTNAVEYKVQFKELICDMLLKNRSIYRNVRQIVQEEPFMSGMKTTVAVLMSLRTSIPEILVEHKDLLNEFEYYEINNKTWKKKFFAPDKCPNNSQVEKAMAKAKLTAKYPVFTGLTQDEVDAASLGIVACGLLCSGQGLKDKVIARPFKYKLEFIGANTLEEAILELSEKVPKELVGTEVRTFDVTARGNLEKKIYSEMGSDDIVLMFQFNERTAGNLILQYHLTPLLDDGEYIFGAVWRANRKK